MAPALGVVVRINEVINAVPGAGIAVIILMIAVGSRRGTPRAGL